MHRVVAFASKPAPTLDLLCTSTMWPPQILSGSGLAREWARHGLTETPPPSVLTSPLLHD
ncbi:hypothetical protein C3E98_024435 [Pseudomonas sp. MWU13-2625]|nr:hypothetical protein C3E98_024435 [Pseudomonas sp. MWU13-2625]